VERSTDTVELLDGPLDDPSALTGNLRDLRRVNRWLGGASLTAPAIEALAAHRPELTLLDVGTGGADIPVDLLARAARRSRRWSIVAIDSRPEVLAAAALAVPEVAATPGLELHVGDGLALPYPDRSFDVVHASMVLHHLTVDEAVRLIREMARVARLGVVVNDLERSRLGWLGAWLMAHLLTGNRYTRHDAPLSVRRSYRAVEMAALLRDAGTVPVKTVRGVMGQRYAIAALSTREASDWLDDRRRWPGRGGTRGPSGDGRPACRRPRALGPLAVASGWRVRVAGRSVGAAADRLGCRSPGEGGPADPGDAGRDAGRCDLSPDLRRGNRGRTGGRVRPVPTGPVAGRAGGVGRRRDPAGMVGHGGRS
jgi:SAM-dependent methyltransferase